MNQDNSALAPSKPTNILPFERDNEASAPDCSTLSAGAKKIRDGLTPDQRKAVKDAKPLGSTEALQALHNAGKHSAPPDNALACIIAGLEKGSGGEIVSVSFLKNVTISHPELGLRWLKNLRSAVQSILGADARSAAKGTSVNVVNEDDFRALCGYAVKALQDANKPHPTLFARGSSIVEVSKDKGISIKDIDFDTFTAKVNLATPFRKSFGTGDSVGYQEVSCPYDVAKFLYNCDLLGFPELKGVSGIPVFLPDGKLLTRQGYHADSGLYLAFPDGLKIPDIANFEKVTQADLTEAMRILVEDLFGDFYLDGVARADLIRSALGGDPLNPPPASLLNAIGLLLEQFVRPMIKGPVMPALISKPLRGAGGGLLNSVVQIVVHGRSTVRPLAASEDERRKSIFTALLGGTAIVAFDNMSGEVSSAVLASVFTEDSLTDRVLGASRERSAPIRASFVMIGNRPLLSDELRRRVSLIQLKPDTARPEHRSDFRHSDLLQWVKEHRGKAIWSVLILVKNWIDQGALTPKHAPVIGSYESYVDVIGGILEAASPAWITWQGNRDELAQIASDDEETDVESLLSAWVAAGGKPMEVADLCALAEAAKITLPVKKTPMGGDFEYSTRALGKFLKGYSGRIFALEDGEYELSQSSTKGANWYPWTLKKKQSVAKTGKAKGLRPQRQLIKPARIQPLGGGLSSTLKSGVEPPNPFD
ncbi:MAG: hypothetical protein ACK4VZ_10610 [Paracoccaceae bacterium]